MGSRWGLPVVLADGLATPRVLRGSGTPETSATARNAPVCRRPKGPLLRGSNEVGGCYSGTACHCHRQEVPAVISGGALSSRSGEAGGQPETVPTGAVEKNLGVLPGVMGSPPESRQDEPRQVGGTRRPASAAGSDGDHDCHGDGGPFWGLPGLHMRSRIRGFRFPSGPFRAGTGALRFGSAAGSFRAREGRVPWWAGGVY